MYFSKSVIITALVGFATAQSSSSSQSIAASETLSSTANSTASAPTTSSTSTASGGSLITHTIQVGGPNGSLAFYPNNIQANAGDMVQFQFHPKVCSRCLTVSTAESNIEQNHSVVQSTFDNPCVPIQNIMANKTNAFFSGFMPTEASANSSSQLLTYTIRIPDDKPIWFYCSQGKHCQAGMVGAINAYAHMFRNTRAVINTNAHTVLPPAKRQCSPSPRSPPKLPRTSAPAREPALAHPAVTEAHRPLDLAHPVRQHWAAAHQARPVAQRRTLPTPHLLSVAGRFSASALPRWPLSPCGKGATMKGYCSYV